LLAIEAGIIGGVVEGEGRRVEAQVRVQVGSGSKPALAKVEDVENASHQWWQWWQWAPKLFVSLGNKRWCGGPTRKLDRLISGVCPN
jgi:hypothetical protein